MARYGYIMLDQSDQDVSRQALQLDSIGGFDRIFVDRQLSGDKAQAGREQRSWMISLLQSGDVVFVAAIDRFCDHLRDFLQIVQEIAAADAELAVLAESLDSRSPSGQNAIRLLKTFERLEFAFQSGRKKAGIQAARQKGRRIGRPQVSIPPGFRMICREWSEGKISGKEAAQQSGLRSTSFYKKAGELGFKAPPRRLFKGEKS